MIDTAVRRENADIIEAVITKGDLSKLSPIEKTAYYNEVCRSVGLNPFTRPFEYISLSGKLTLYARREATDQLRRINGISLEVVSQEVVGDILTVHVRAKDKTGRTDEDFGSVNIAGQRGEALANCKMKALTKAKRRVTLSISGLGFLDESEVEGIPAHEWAAPQDTRADLDQFAGLPARAPEPAVTVDWETGEALDAADLERDARRVASDDGTAGLRTWLRARTRTQRDLLAPLVGTAEQPGVLLRLAQDADAATIDAVNPSPAPLSADAPLSPPIEAANNERAGDTMADMLGGDPRPPASHRWQIPRDPSARDWQGFADWLDSKLADGISGKALRGDNETALRRLKAADPALYDAVQEKVSAARG